MHFDLVDRVIEHGQHRIVTIKNVTGAEEYLQDHFPGYPVLPGVMMLEAMVQAARRMLVLSQRPGASRLVLGRVRALKYGRFVRPGDALLVEVILKKESEGAIDFDATARLIRATEIARVHAPLSPGAGSPAADPAGVASPGTLGGDAEPRELPVAASGKITLRAVRLANRALA
ncbi:MAG: polyketide synthase dehydratase domain-containing protein [Planctomycetota bacterium]|nr:polyketide synthase dehydratase domain-containing protein [Planctomycetota bacterium]